MSKPHNQGSFSYKVTNNLIKRILTERSKVSNTVQVGMPFVKATSTVAIEELLGPGNIGFTLGIHSLPDVTQEDIFASPQGNADDAFVGYTYTANGLNKKIFATTPSPNTPIGRFFTPDSRLQTTARYQRVPPPGITGLKIGRNRSGVTVSADLDISVPSLSQLEYLNKVFLIPGCGIVVEWGQQFAPQGNVPTQQGESIGETGLARNIADKLFPWYKRDELKTLLTRLGQRAVPMEEILQNYVYPTQGQYMWIFGRIGNISTKGNADGSFNVTVKIVGPAEDQWAYSVRQTAITQAEDGSKPCINNSNSVEQYLTQTTAGGYNLMTLLDGILSNTIPELSAWSGHVIQIENGNKSDGEGGEESTPNVNQASFADSDNAYYMTWRFFVNVVLNYMPKDANSNFGGIKGIYRRANLADSIVEKIKILRPYGGYDGVLSPGTYPLDDPLEDYIGCHAYLRSYDPGTMVIVNEFAAADAESEYNTGTGGAQQFVQALQSNEHTTRFLNLGGNGVFDFLNSDPNPTTTKKEDIDRGLLSTGVWLNHKAVISSMLGGTTILQGISNLLNRMNNATKNYWSLTLDPLDAVGAPYDYVVVDQNYKANSDEAVQDLLTGNNKIYTFNKYLRTTPQGIVGSELIDFNVDLDLPKLLFSQIAAMGINQPGDRDVAEGKPYKGCKTPTISDGNENLRILFGAQTVAPTNGFPSIDLTHESNVPKPPAACGAPTVGTAPAGSGGVGAQPAPAPATNESDSKQTEELKKKAKEIEDFLKDPANRCEKCAPCFSAPLFPPTPVYPPGSVYNVGAVNPTMKGSVLGYPNAQVPLSALSVISSPYPEYRINRSGNPGADKRYQGKQWLEKEAAAQFQKMLAHAKATGCPAFTITSAYRDLQHQSDLKSASVARGGNGVAPVGSSPHGMGRALDFAELFAAADNGSTTAASNRKVRETSNLYKWLAANGPKFGWYNPKRLADGQGKIDEAWHFEYWGYADEYPPGSVSPPAATTTAKGTTFGAVFVTGLTRDISAERQLQAFKDGVGADKRVFSAPYSNIAAVKTFLAQNPKTPVFLYSAGAGSANVNALIDDPNVDKQKLFLIEPFFGDSTRAAIVTAISKGLPASNVYGGPVPERGGGNKKINGTSTTPSNLNHFQAPTYVGQQKASVVPAAQTSAPSTGTTGNSAPSQTQQKPAQQNGCTEELLIDVGTEGVDFNFTRAQKIQGGRDRCNEAEKKCRLKAEELKQINLQLQPAIATDAAIATATEQFPNMNIIMRYVEIQPDHMVAKIRCTADGKRSNAFGAAPGTLSIKADLTLPGIAGLRVGELFWIDRIPAYYKYFGAFQVMGIEDTIGIDGWQTKIHAVFNFLGITWKDTMLRLNPPGQYDPRNLEVADVYDG